MRIDIGMPIQPEPLPDTQIADAAFAVKALCLIFMTLHAQLTQPAIVGITIACMRRIDPIIVQTACKPGASLALLHGGGRLCRHHPALPIVPALPIDRPGFEMAYGGPVENAVACLGCGVAMKTDSSGGISSQRQWIVEQHERVRRHR